MNDLLKKTINLGDLLKYVIPMIASIIGGYMIMSTRMQALELRYEFKNTENFGYPHFIRVGYTVKIIGSGLDIYLTV